MTKGQNRSSFAFPQISLAKLFKMAASHGAPTTTIMGDYKTLSCKITSNNNEHGITFVKKSVRVNFSLIEQNSYFPSQLPSKNQVMKTSFFESIWET